MKIKSILWGLLLMPTSLLAQSNCNCCSAEYQQFNFWLGEWIVHDTAGKQIGFNTISIVQDSCALREQWESKTSTGTSLSYYDRNTGKWNQLWIDNSGGNLNLQGSLRNGKMIMYAQATDSSLHRITWTPKNNGDVEQRWDVVSLDQKVMSTLFIGIYSRIETYTED